MRLFADILQMASDIHLLIKRQLIAGLIAGGYLTKKVALKIFNATPIKA
jgi:uncharacterized protein YneF (UPF0154 family)